MITTEQKNFELVFIRIYSIFSIYHFLTDPFDFVYGQPLKPITLIGILLSFLVLMRPKKLEYFVSLLILTLTDYILKAPINSNHTMITTFLMLGLLGTFGWQYFFKFPWALASAKFVRQITICIYFFAFFSKLNFDYFDPDVSCANKLLQDVPFGKTFLNIPYGFEFAAYGSVLIEGLIFLLLIIPRWNRYAVAIAIPFHCALALSGAAFFAAFSTLCFFLIFCFVPPEIISNFNNSKIGNKIRSHFKKNPLLTVTIMTIVVALHLLFFFITKNDYKLLILPWFIIALPICLFTAVIVSKEWTYKRRGRFPKSLNIFYIVLTGLFILNALCPYLGLKTKQSLNMFSNLNTAGGHSNHLIASWPPGPFNYTKQFVTLDKTYNPRTKTTYDFKDRSLVYYEFLNLLEKSPTIKVNYTLNDEQKFTNVSFLDLEKEAKAMLHSKFVRKWFGFLPFNHLKKQPCTWPIITGEKKINSQ